jgi:hypothetical protein
LHDRRRETALWRIAHTALIFARAFCHPVSQSCDFARQPPVAKTAGLFVWGRATGVRRNSHPCHAGESGTGTQGREKSGCGILNRCAYPRGLRMTRASPARVAGFLIVPAATS